MSTTASKSVASKSASKRRQKRKDERGPTMAEQADRHVLYQKSVQDVESEIDFIDERFQALRGRKAILLREDFCGTANTTCEWVKRHKTSRGVAVDLDGEVLQWGRDHNVGSLDADQKKRIDLVEDDVLKVKTERADVVLAMNFSYWLFRERSQMIGYFKKVREALVDEGVFFLDAYGGWEAHQEIEEERECDGFDYIWDQAEFDPISGRMQCYIHFKFPDRSRIDRAFSYVWRLWSLPEIREMLTEAGFSKSTIYWEGADEDGDGNGEFEPVEVAESDPGWICYIVAEK